MTTGFRAVPEGWLWLGLVCLAVWPTLASFHGVWTSYTYSHGYLAAAVAVWFGWRHLRDGLPGEGVDEVSWAGFVIVGLSLVWLVATVLHLRVVHQGVLPLMLVAWAGMAGGIKGARAAAPAAWLALFAIPFWEAFVPPLQALTVMVSGTVVDLMGIGAEISENVIAIPSGRFEVAGSCSGLNYFIVGSFLGSTYAYLFVDRARTRLQVIALAAITAMLANWVRVVGLVVIGHVTEMQHSLMTSHHAYGWVVFALFMGAWLWGVERRSGRNVRASAQSVRETSHAQGGWGRQSYLATGLVLIGPAIYWLVTAIPAQPIDTYASEFSPRDGWLEERVGAETVEWGPEYPGADLHERAVLSRDSVTIFVDRVTFL
ncbi:MAG: exosortase, partial [Actinomycetota bacterium]